VLSLNIRVARAVSAELSSKLPLKKSIGPSSAWRFALAAILPLAMLAGPRQAFPSCWASNPAGTRSCARYVNRSGGFEFLCEDNPGDCESLGYTKAPQFLANSPRSNPKQSHTSGAHGPNPSRLGHSAEIGGGLPPTETVPESGSDADRPETAGTREYSGERSDSVATYPNETEIAVLLIAILVLTGTWILPPPHRAVLLRIAQGVAVVAGVVFVFFLVLLSAASSGSSSSRRRRYY
jgi:hypothetical protein